MRPTPPTTIDVRDMLCAQALAVVAQAIRALRPGQTAAVYVTAEDVQRDLIVWATAQGHGVTAPVGQTLHITREHHDNE